MTMKALVRTLTACAAALIASVATAQTTVYDAHQSVSLYGRLAQNDLPGIGNVACGPSATANSLLYLQNRYGSIYGASLVPAQSQDLNHDGKISNYDALMAAAQTLASPGYANTQSYGTPPGPLLTGTRKYLEERAAGKFVIAAQSGYPWDPVLNPQPTMPVEHAWPSWNFLYSHLQQGSAVQIMLDWTTGGHYVSLTGLHWGDSDGDGTVDAGEATAECVDPWTATVMTRSLFQTAPGGEFYLDSMLSHSRPALGAAITITAVPEPASLLLLSVASLALLRRRAC